VSTALNVSAGVAFTRMMSIAHYRPPRVVSNDEICESMDSTDEWIRERSGIIERHWAAADQSVADMAVLAGEQAIAAAGIDPLDIGMVIVATCTHPYQTPSAAAEVADRVGATAAGSADVSSACAGFSYAVGLADSLVRGGTCTYVLVVGSEKLSDFTDPSHRGTGFIFADGAGATVIGPSDAAGIGPTIWGSDGSQKDTIRTDRDWITFAHDLLDDPSIKSPTLRMEGQAVFRWAVGDMPKVVSQAIEAAGLTAQDIDVFIPHQANMRITDAMVRTLGFPAKTVIARDIATTGNTSSASIPIAMSRMLEAGEITSGQTAALVGFGAGLTYSAQVVMIP